jgi:hypothetical protein
MPSAVPHLGRPAGSGELFVLGAPAREGGDEAFLARR